MAVAGSLALGSLASAQNSTKLLSDNSIAQSTAAPNPPPSFFAIRAGIAFPIDGGLSDVSTLFVGAGVDFTFSNNIFKNSETFISIDWLGRTHGRERFNLFPLAINQRFYLNPGQTGKYGAAAGTYYAFIGLGGTIYDFQDSNFRFSGRAGLGAMITQNWLAEATLYLGEPDKGIHADAIGLYVGYRFGG
jgi:hypothetical protein